MTKIVSSKPLQQSEMEMYKFYNGTVTLRFDKTPHIYYLETAAGLTKVLNVTTIVKIVDKSDALTSWASKMCAEKAIRLMPFTEAGVTKIMSREDFATLMNTAKSAHRDRLTEAGDLGSAAHQCLEDSIKYAMKATGGKVEHLINLPLDERASNGAEAGFKWMQEHNVRWNSTESKIYSIKFNFSGTMDGICYVDSCSDPKCCSTSFKNVLSLADWKTSNYLHIEYLYQTAAYVLAFEEEFPEPLIEDRWILRLGKDDAEFEPWHLTRKDLEEDTRGFLACLNLMNAHSVVTTRTAATKKFKSAARRAAALSEKALRAEAEQLEKNLEKDKKAQLNALLKEEKAKEKDRKAAEKKAKKGVDQKGADLV